MKILATIVALVLLAGCATVSDQVVRGVNAYCSEPYTTRVAVRGAVNAKLVNSGNSVQVICDGDPKPL